MPRLGVVALASGESRRFDGGEKLLARAGGRAMLAYVLDALPPDVFQKRLVVTRSPRAAALALSLGFEALVHTLPEMSDTIRLGVERMAGMDGCLFCVGDQPLLTARTVRRLAGTFEKDPSRIVRACFGERDGNPVLFPAALFGELAALAPGQSGGAVIRRHAGLVTRVQALSARELKDVDTRQDFDWLVAELSTQKEREKRAAHRQRKAHYP